LPEGEQDFLSRKRGTTVYHKRIFIRPLEGGESIFPRPRDFNCWRESGQVSLFRMEVCVNSSVLPDYGISWRRGFVSGMKAWVSRNGLRWGDGD
jgi:hypothetical protein